jgi:hypothetical protein
VNRIENSISPLRSLDLKDWIYFATAEKTSLASTIETIINAQFLWRSAWNGPEAAGESGSATVTAASAHRARFGAVLQSRPLAP